MRLLLSAIAIIITSCLCLGQSLSIGVIGGATPTNDLTGAGAVSASKRYVIGPAVDIGLPLGFGIQADALYRREGYQSSFFSFAASIFSDERANSWEFPILIKHRLPFSDGKLFVEGGYAPRVIHGSIRSTFFETFPNPSPAMNSNTGTSWPVATALSSAVEPSCISDVSTYRLASVTRAGTIPLSPDFTATVRPGNRRGIKSICCSAWVGRFDRPLHAPRLMTVPRFL